MVELMEHQTEASRLLGNGKVLWGGVGSGKSITVLNYYVDNEEGRDIYVITTAKKRDSLDWEKEAVRFGIGTDVSVYGRITVDSWNNIGKYRKIKDAFFIFDEQRVVGHGAWVKAFLKIARGNHWVLLSATPGDIWMDYAPVFIANGYFEHMTDFKFKHVLYEPFQKYPKIRGYLNESRLEELRNEVLVEMPYFQESRRVTNFWEVGYNHEMIRAIYKNRWNVYEDRPVKDAAEMFRLMRKVVNSDPSRLEEIRHIHKMHPRLVIFYNFDYELDILRTLGNTIPTFEWNGHRKDPLPETDNWVYLVQYVAGAEGWNCTTTDAMILYSLTYSYKNFIQAMGRIDRLNTEYDTLYYYIFVSNSVIDRAIQKSLGEKRSFNERKALEEMEEMGVLGGMVEEVFTPCLEAE